METTKQLIQKEDKSLQKETTIKFSIIEIVTFQLKSEELFYL